MAKSSIRTRVQSVGTTPPQIDGIPVENELLLGLPSKERDCLFPKLVFIPLRTEDNLHEPGQPIKYGYFINSGMISILSVMADGKSVEVGLTGKEGFVGCPLLVGLSTSSNRAVVQLEASGFRIRAADLAPVLRECPTLEKRLLQFVQFMAMQGTQVAACNRLHEVDERLARWLLMSADRIGSMTVPLTQEFLSHMLGTRRASVTIAAGRLQKAGLITYRRGEVIISNRDRLLAKTCECYEAMLRQMENWRTESAKD